MPDDHEKDKIDLRMYLPDPLALYRRLFEIIKAVA